MAETTSSERQAPSATASTSGGQRAEIPQQRRLAVVTWLMAALASLLVGLPALWLHQQQSRHAALVIVENQAKLASLAMTHHLTLRRESRASMFSSVAARVRPIEAGHRVWEHLAQEARAVGADLVAVVDEGGALLAQDGAGAIALAEAAARSGIAPSGALLVMGAQIVEAFRIPVAYDGKQAFLIAACRILPESLRQDAEPLGLGVAIALEGSFVTNLPADALSSGRWGDDPRESLHNLSVRYHLRATPLWQGRLLVAVPLQSVQQWSRDQLIGSLLLVGLLLGGVLLLALWVQLGVMSPLLRMSGAASRVSQGSLARGRAQLKPFLDRNDELATIGKGLDWAVQRLQSLLHTSNRVLDDIDSTIATIERSASTLATSSGTQEERSKEVQATVVPITRAIERLTRQMVEVRNAVVQISLAWSNADQAQAQVLSAARRADSMLHNPEAAESRTFRTASVAQQLQLITQTLNEEREALSRIRDQVTTLRSTVDGAMDSVGFDDSTGAAVGRSILDISRLARQQTAEAESLRNVVEQLRKDSEKLSLLIQAIQTRATEELASTSGNWGIGAANRGRRTGDSLTRSSTNLAQVGSRPLAAASSQALRPIGSSSGPSPKTSGATGTASGERRVSNPGSAHSPRSSTSGSSPGLKPVGSTSSPGVRPVSASSQSLRPISAPDGVVSKSSSGIDREISGKRDRDRVSSSNADLRLSAQKIGSRPPSDPKPGDG